MSGYPSLNEFFQELMDRFRTSIFPDCELHIPLQIDDWKDAETRSVKITASGIDWLNLLNRLLGPGLDYARETPAIHTLINWRVERNNNIRPHEDSEFPSLKNIIDESPMTMYLRGTGMGQHQWLVVPQLLIRFDERSPNWFHSIWTAYWRGPEDIKMVAYEADQMRPRTGSDLPLSYWHSPQLEDMVQDSQVSFLVPNSSMMVMGKPVTIVLCFLEEVWRMRYAEEPISLAWSLSISALK